MILSYSTISRSLVTFATMLAAPIEMLFGQRMLPVWPLQAEGRLSVDSAVPADASALTGALVLSMASVASKNLIPGVIIPVGIVTSLVGVPFFAIILYRARPQT